MRKRNAIALAILLLIIGTLLLYQTPLMRSARGATWELVVRRVAKLFKVGQIKVTPDVSQQLSQLIAENVRLTYELKDYQHLKKELGSPSFDSFRIVESAVLARPIDTFQTEYMLAKGVSEGVVPGSPVVVNGSILVGFITDATEHSATLRLLLHPKTSLTAQINTDENDEPAARGLLSGKQYTSLVLTTIPRDIVLKAGQKIVTTGGQQVPGGLFIGTIGAISNKENEPYQEAEVSLPYDPGSLDAVSILVQL